MNKLPCEVVKDLLPSYIDELTSGTTNELIEAHLKTCQDCRAVCASMKGPEAGMEWEEQEKKEIDFLKKNKKRNRRIAIWSIAGALVLVLGILAARVFLIGDSGFSNWAPMDLKVEGNKLTFTAVPMDSASAIADLGFVEEEGVVTVTARSVLASPLCPGSRSGEFTAKEEIKEVRIGSRIIWADGATVSVLASELFEAGHEYIGDMPANSRLANALGMGVFLGPYSNELETAKEPYGWKMSLALDIPTQRLAQKERDMDAFGYVLIALTGNLDHVTFEYNVDGAAQTRTVTAAEATEFFGEDIKNCGRNVRTLDRLLEKTGLNLYASHQEPAEEEAANEVWIQVVNMSDSELEGIGTSCFLDDVQVSNGYGMNADESPIKAGESIWESFSELDFGGEWKQDSVLEVLFTIHTTDGQVIVLPDRIRIPAAPGTARIFRLVGNPETGFQMLQ